MTKKYSNDIFTVIRELDNKNYNYLSTLTADEYKEIQPYVLLKWLSSTSTETTNEFYTLTTNEFVNKNFWKLSNHKELQWKLLCVCGLKQHVKHQWIPSKSSKKPIDKYYNEIKKLFPHLNNLEYDNFYNTMDNQTKSNYLEYLGLKDKTR